MEVALRAAATAHTVPLAVSSLDEIADGRFTARLELDPSGLSAALAPRYPAQCAVDGAIVVCGARGLERVPI